MDENCCASASSHCFNTCVPTLDGLVLRAVYCNKKLRIKMRFNNFNWPLIREIAVYSFWIFLNVIMDRIYWSTGQFVLGVTAGPTTVAIYGIAITIMAIYMSYSTAIAGVLHTIQTE